jgi:hypothetical protein
MAKHVFVVLTNPVAGKEDSYNDWYTNVHLGDVLQVPGIIAAQRFKLSDVQRGEPPFPWRYLALYDVDTDDLNHTLAVLKERSGTSAMVISDALAPERLAWFFEPITPRVEASQG